MSLWHRIEHPCIWFTRADLPRLKANARLAFWRPKFEQWRNELAEVDRLPLTTPTIDFHKGSNTQALKAALCYVVDEDEHYGRLIASFLREVVGYYKDHGPDWHPRMAGRDDGGWWDQRVWVGQQWGGLSNSHIVDPMMWFSCAHLYDVIYGKGMLDDADAALFEQMMGRFHRLCCLHEELKKLDNNRAAWLNGGSYVSTLFDSDDARAAFCRRRARTNMERLIATILDDGVHYEIGPYAIATISALHMSARCMKQVEGVDFFHRQFDGVGLEDAYRAWVGLLMPGSSLRLPLWKDRVNHWDSICGGYLEYQHPELGWAISRIGERSWVPMFRHWPQGAEFYTYREPDNAQPPRFLDSHFPNAGMAILRSDWRPEAQSLYFRYGFQGSSHGGGLDKLNIELTCNDEPLLSDALTTEFSHDKNVVLVDHHNQEQCSGKLINAQLDADQRLQYISAVGGFGQHPDREVFHDPCTELEYWETKSQECFPGVARMRRTILFIDRRYWLIRDTLRVLDDQDHAYQWLFHTFAQVGGLDARLGDERHTYYPKRIYATQHITPVSRTFDRYALSEPGRLSMSASRAQLDLYFMPVGAAAPETASVRSTTGRYAYNGSPEAGDGLATATMFDVQLELAGRDVAMTTVLDARPRGRAPYVERVEPLESRNVDQQIVRVRHAGGIDTIVINESSEPLDFAGRTYHDIALADDLPRKAN